MLAPMNQIESRGDIGGVFPVIGNQRFTRGQRTKRNKLYAKPVFVAL